MNITEANAVNKLLSYFLRRPEGSASDALSAAIWLADRARAALHAGLDGTDVELNWRDIEDLIDDEVEALIDGDVMRADVDAVAEDPT